MAHPTRSTHREAVFAGRLDRIDEFGPTEYVWGDPEIGVRGHPQRKVESKARGVQQDRRAADQEALSIPVDEKFSGGLGVTS